MRTRRARVCLGTLLLSLLLSSVSFGTYIYGDYWDFVDDFSGTTNPVKDADLAVVWKYLGGDSNKAPSTAGLLVKDLVHADRWVGVDADPTGEDPDYPIPGWIEKGVMHAESGLYLGAQRTPFLQWVSPVSGQINIEIHVTNADKSYQADVFLNDFSLDSQSGSSSNYTYTNNEPKNVGIGSKVTLRINQDVLGENPTVHTTFRVTYIPEPMTITMIGSGLVGLLVRRRNLSL